MKLTLPQSRWTLEDNSKSNPILSCQHAFSWHPVSIEGALDASFRAHDKVEGTPFSINSTTTSRGVTLIEMLLVLVLISVLVVTLMNAQTRKTEQVRSDRAALQAKEILNAGLAYYILNGQWPLTNPYQCNSSATSTLTSLYTAGLLPLSTITNPWGRRFKIGCNATTGNFLVTTQTPSVTEAMLLAGRMPNGFVTDTTGAAARPPNAGTCTTQPYGSNCVFAVGSVAVPGQNMMNARSVNFASVYHSGACVPAPFCPPGTNPHILVVPVGVAGVNDNPCSDPYDTSTCTNAVVNPVSSFTAVAYPASPAQINSAANTIRSCASSSIRESCYTTYSASVVTVVQPGKYWRVCLYAKTDRGDIIPDTSSWGQSLGSVLAITNCEPSSEFEGADFQVWQQ